MHPFKTTLMSCLLPCVLIALTSGIALAQAPTLLVDGPDEVNITTNFSVDIDVQLPAGDYSGLQLKVVYPSAFEFVGSGSPTSGEFGDSVGISGGRAWNQEMTLDLSAGAGVRKFRITGHLNSNTVADGGPVTFTVTLTGQSSEVTGGPFAPFTTDPALHTTRGRGTGALIWQNSGSSFANTTTIGGGPIVSGETVPRPGVLRRFVFGTRNSGDARLGGTQTWTINGGAGYRFVRAFGHGWSTVTPANPDNASTSVTITSSHTPWQPLVGPITAVYTGFAEVPPSLFVDVFVPCDDFGRTPEQNTELAANYQFTGRVENTFVPYLGAPLPLEITHGPVGTLNLTNTCGQGGGVSKLEENVGFGGAGPRWRVIVNPPFGVSELEDAMLVDVLHPGVQAISQYDANATILDHFGAWVCNFDGVFTGYFTASQFLAERDTHCRAGYGNVLPTDTHIVYYTANWQGELGGPLLPVTAYIETRFDADWARNNVGALVPNTAYFNASNDVFGAFGDTLVEATNEDPWEATDLSDPLPQDINGLVLDVSRDTNGGNVNSGLIDANGQTRVFYARVRPTPIYPLNPRFSLTIPNGVEVLSVAPSPTDFCVEFPTADHRVFPGDLTSSTLTFGFGDTTAPWRLRSEGCRAGGNITFRLDSDYPFIDGEVITFAGVATSDSQVAADPTDSTTFTAVVTTGMDVRLEGGCWTGPEFEVTPPRTGLILYKATAINRGREDLEAMELRFIVPAGSIYQTAFAGEDFPVGTALEVSRDNGTTWAVAPTLPDATVTDVRIAGFSIEGLGVAAMRPTFYVAVLAIAPTGTIDGTAWVETPTANLGRTPEKVVQVDAESCEVPCECAPSLNPCATSGCNELGECVDTLKDDGTSCVIEGDLCVLAAECTFGKCRATSRVECGDAQMCTSDVCEPTTGECDNIAADCSNRPVFMPVLANGQPAGAVKCSLAQSPTGMTLECDTSDGVFNLHPRMVGVCEGTVTSTGTTSSAAAALPRGPRLPPGPQAP